MTPYELGVKLATSRWHEAIRSGEVSPQAAETMRKGMGFDPKAHGRGLERGARRIAQREGYTLYKHTPQRYAQQAWKALRGADWSKGPIKAIQGANWEPLATRAPGLAIAKMMGGAATLPDANRIDIMGGQIATKKGLLPAVTMHEAVESQLANKPGARMLRQPKPDYLSTLRKAAPGVSFAEGVGTGMGKPLDLRKEILKGVEGVMSEKPQMAALFTSSAHMGGEAPLTDLREARLLGKKPLKHIEKIRRMTGELPVMEEAAGQMGRGGALIPRKQMPQIAQRMRTIAEAQPAEALAGGRITRAAGRGGEVVGKGIQRLLKLIGR